MARIAPLRVRDGRGTVWVVSARRRRVSPALAARLGRPGMFADDATAHATGCLLALLVSPWLIFVPWMVRRPRVWILVASGPDGASGHWASGDRTRAAASASVRRLAEHLAGGHAIESFGIGGSRADA